MEAVSNTEKGKANQELLRRKGRESGGWPEERGRRGERRGEEKDRMRKGGVRSRRCPEDTR